MEHTVVESGRTVGLAVADNLLHVQRRTRLNDAELERRAKLGDRYLQKLRLGKIADPAYSLLLRLAAVCGVSLDHLVSGHHPAPVVVIPAAYYAARFGLHQPLLVSGLGVMAQHLALWLAEGGSSLPPLVAYRPSPSLIRLVNLLDCTVNLLLTELEQAGVEVKLRQAEFANLSNRYQRLAEGQRLLVLSLASSMVSGAEASQPPGNGAKLTILLGEVGSLTKSQPPVRAFVAPSPQANLGLTVAANLMALQQRAGITDAELERQALLGRTYLQKLRQGAISEPGYAVVAQLAAACGVSSGYLTGETEPQPLLLAPVPFYAARYGLFNPLCVRALETIAEVVVANGDLRTAITQALMTQAGNGDAATEPVAQELAGMQAIYLRLPAEQRQWLTSLIGSLPTSSA